MSERMWGFVLVREVLASLLTDLSNILEEEILLRVVPEVPWDRTEGLGEVPKVRRGVAMELCVEAGRNGARVGCARALV